MPYAPQQYEQLIGMEGFSEQLLRNHFKLYEGYVTNSNKLTDALTQAAIAGNTATPEYAELKRRFGWEFNGMRLHELYFSNMTKDKTTLETASPLVALMAKTYGSRDNWEKDFRSTGAMRGIGWTIMYFDKTSGSLMNVWVNEHDLGHLAGAEPLLVLDVFEHAYMLDYGINRAAYIDAFMKAVDWRVVEMRYSVGMQT